MESIGSSVPDTQPNPANLGTNVTIDRSNTQEQIRQDAIKPAMAGAGLRKRKRGHKVIFPAATYFSGLAPGADTEMTFASSVARCSRRRRGYRYGWDDCTGFRQSSVWGKKW